MGLTSSQQTGPDGSFTPSKISLNDPKAISCPTPFKLDEAGAFYKGDKRILIVGTENMFLECQNGKKFWTGHNPTEIWMPLAHLAHAGFKFDFATPTGKPIVVEEWAWLGVKACGIEEPLRKVAADCKEGTDKPILISEGLKNLVDGKYILVFLPGGHGALNFKKDVSKDDTGKILAHCHANKITTATLCHGPDALRCAPKDTYKGYKVSAFLDKMDVMSAKFGYLPGKLFDSDLPQKNLIAEQGCIYTNKKNNDSVTVDRELITGSTNLASQRFGSTMVKHLQGVLENGVLEKPKEEVEAKLDDLTLGPKKCACKCGDVTWEVSVQEPIAAAFCHSKDFQELLKADFVKLAAVHEEDFKVTQGEDKLAGEDRKEKGVRSTCKGCNAFVFSRYPVGVLSIQADDLGPKFQPTMHIHYEERKADATDDYVKHMGAPPLSILTE